MFLSARVVPGLGGIEKKSFCLFFSHSFAKSCKKHLGNWCLKQTMCPKKTRIYCVYFQGGIERCYLGSIIAVIAVWLQAMLPNPEEWEWIAPRLRLASPSQVLDESTMLCGWIYSVPDRVQHKHCPGNSDMWMSTQSVEQGRARL